MRESRAAIRYAKAVLSHAIDIKKEGEINDDMQLIGQTLDENQALRFMIHSPVIKNAIKKDALSAIFKGKVNEVSIRLIGLLIENKRLNNLKEVAEQYTILYDRHQGTQIAKVTSAIALTDDLKKQILAKVKELVGKEVAIENTIDPAILGGFILRVGDQQFDASISGKLNNLRRTFDNQAAVSN